MSLPIATRHVDVLAAVEDLTARDSYDDPPTWETLAGGVRAVIASSSGSERTSRAEAETVTATLSLDPFGHELTHLHRIRDDAGVVWQLTWAQYVPGLGLDHWQAGLVRYDGQEP